MRADTRGRLPRTGASRLDLTRGRASVGTCCVPIIASFIRSDHPIATDTPDGKGVEVELSLHVDVCDEEEVLAVGGCREVRRCCEGIERRRGDVIACCPDIQFLRGASLDGHSIEEVVLVSLRICDEERRLAIRSDDRLIGSIEHTSGGQIGKQIDAIARHVGCDRN